MPRRDLSQLYNELLGSRFAFIQVGEHHLHDIYSAVHYRHPDLCDGHFLCRENCSNGHNQPEWQHLVRRVLNELKSNDGDVRRSHTHKHWVFSNAEPLPEAFDTKATPQTRVLQRTYRILRDSELAKRVKALYRNRCQVCGLRINLPNGGAYSEAHHIRPLGKPHNGPDRASNVLVLCPNHHAMCDYGAMTIDPRQLHLHRSHTIDHRCIEYHNTIIAGEHALQT